MPELPEVETVVRDLRPLLVGRRICAVESSSQRLREPWPRECESAIIGQCVRSLSRRGKWILVELDACWLLFHLGMTGQLTIADPRDVRSDHTHLVFTLDDAVSELRFRDIRRFGSGQYFASISELRSFLDARLGPEPWDWTLAQCRAALTASRRAVKAVLLDQTVVAGIGNIYADESLFAARLHPLWSAQGVTPRQAARLHRSIRSVLTRAIESRGSTIRNYVGGSGLSGRFQNEFQVYGQDGRPCPRCGTRIEVVRVVGRSSHFCPRCQPAPRVRPESA